MTHPTRLSRAGTGLLVTALLLTASACDTPPPSSAPPPSENTSAVRDPAETAPPSSEAALRAYYESLIADLKQDLLDEKQADYITRLDYEARIARLEEKLAELQNNSALDSPPLGTDLPVSSRPDPSPAETESPSASRPTTAAFHYTVENGSAVITAYRGTATRVEIPARIAGFPVSRIEDDAFRATDVTAVTVPDGVTAIGWFAFADCPDLLTVTLPASLERIDYGAFDNCPSLTVLCPADSYAERYAKSFALRVEYLPA
jgi:hypothetical protein